MQNMRAGVLKRQPLQSHGNAVRLLHQKMGRSDLIFTNRPQACWSAAPFLAKTPAKSGLGLHAKPVVAYQETNVVRAQFFLILVKYMLLP